MTSALGLVLLAWQWGAAQVPAAEPLARLLPANTVLFVSTPDVARCDQRWQQTSYAALKKDKRIEAFLDDVRLNKQEEWLTPHDRFGTEWEDLLAIAGGEVAGGVLPLGFDRYATVMLVDITGRQAQVQANMAKVDRHWAALGGQRSVTSRLGVPVIVYDLPPKNAKRGSEQRAYLQLGNVAVDTDRLEVVDGIIQRHSGKSADSLAAHPPFATIMTRSTSLTSEPQPDARWYIDPLAMWKLIDGAPATAAQPAVQRPSTTRQASTSTTAKKTTGKKSGSKQRVDWRAVFERQGGKAIRGMGGAVHFSVDRFDFLHRTFVLAPPPLEKAMQMLSFTPGADYAPPAWVGQMVTRYSSFYSAARPLYDGYSHLFNEIYGEGDEGFFQDIINSLKTDPEGPQVDIRRDVVEKLGPRLIAVRDEFGPLDAVGNPGRRVLLAAVANDWKTTFDTIDRFYKGDPEFDRVDYRGRVLWTANQPGAALFGPGDDPAMPAYNTLSVVPEGFLFLATDVELVQEVLDALSSPKQSLAQAADYQYIQGQLRRFLTPQTFAQHFSRTDEEARETYELLRNGKLAEGRTWDAQLLNSFLFGTGKPAAGRRQVDGRKLPDFRELRHHFGPGGLSAELTADGWQMFGFVVRKAAPKD